MTKELITLKDGHYAELLNKCRASRSLLLRDAEAFHEAARVLEDVGVAVSGKKGIGLGKYESHLIEFASITHPQDVHNLQSLFNVIKDVRNAAVHEGAHLRQLGGRLIEFLLLLESSLMTKLHKVGLFMVPNPVMARPWHTLAQIRTTMLANSFSYLVYEMPEGSEWSLVSDHEVLLAIHKRCEGQDANDHYLVTIEDAIRSQRLKLTPCKKYPYDTTVDSLRQSPEHLPALVTDTRTPKNLLGIITAFDLL